MHLTSQSDRAFSVVAIIAAFNEEDIIARCIEHLVRDGISVYLIDHSSTDATVDEAKPFLGRGLLHIERFPDECGFAPELKDSFCWKQLLHRKEMLARTIDANWFIHHDADEFRSSPWPHLSLKEAIHAVDAAGFNAIDFELFQFHPTDDRFAKGDDPTTAFLYFGRTETFDRIQVKAWKKSPGAQLTPSGGHEVSFSDRSIYPIPFLLRHYPIRTQAHGIKKVFSDRRPRFDPSEREMGWHRQYNQIDANEIFVKDAQNLTRFDLDAARLGLFLKNRQTEALRSIVESTQIQLDATQNDLRWYRHEWSKREGELLTSMEASARLERLAETLRIENDTMRGELTSASAQITSLKNELHAAHHVADEQHRQIQSLESSLSWRITAPAREALRRVRGY